MSFLSCTVQLPPHFRANDILAFHRRDPLLVAERVEAGTLQKGLTWQGEAACLTIRFHPDHADAELAMDNAATPDGSELLQPMVQRMLGLTQQIEVFEDAYCHHPQLGPLIAQHPGLRVPLTAAAGWLIYSERLDLFTVLGAALILSGNLLNLKSNPSTKASAPS